jgi:predicted acetyltransferase
VDDQPGRLETQWSGVGRGGDDRGGTANDRRARVHPTYRGIDEAERDQVAAMVMLAFGNPQARDYAARTAAEEFRVLEVDGEIVSVLRHARLAQWWLGRAVPSSQVLQFATPPEHQAKGWGAELLGRLMAELHESGVPTATLRASTSAFYRTVGFEFAGDWSVYEVACEYLPRKLAPWRARQLGLDELAPVFELYERVAPTRHGAFVRDRRWWQKFTREGWDNPATCFLLESGDGRPAGWAMVVFEPGPMAPGAAWRSLVDVLDWGCLPGAERGLLALMAGWAPLGGYLQWSGPDPDPVLFALGDERAVMRARYHWMLRLIDVAAVFAARPYPEGVRGEVAFTVSDTVCPWNQGGWRLVVEGGKAEVTRAAQTPAARAEPRGLAALFTGFADPGLLSAAGLLSGFSEQEVDLLRAAFAGPRPWTSEHY